MTARICSTDSVISRSFYRLHTALFTVRLLPRFWKTYLIYSGNWIRIRFRNEQRLYFGGKKYLFGRSLRVIWAVYKIYLKQISHKLMHQKPSQHKSKMLFSMKIRLLFRFQSDCLIEKCFRWSNDPKVVQNVPKWSKIEL